MSVPQSSTPKGKGPGVRRPHTPVSLSSSHETASYIAPIGDASSPITPTSKHRAQRKNRSKFSAGSRSGHFHENGVHSGSDHLQTTRCPMCNLIFYNTPPFAASSWLRIVYETIRLLHDEGTPHRKYFHYKHDICSFIDRNWSKLCPDKKRTLTWNNTVSAVITTHRKLFKSNTRQSGFWTLLPPPGMASLVADGDSEDENVDYAEKAREMKAQSRSGSSNGKKRKPIDIPPSATPKPVAVSKPISSPTAHMKAYYTDGPAPKMRKTTLAELHQPKPLLWSSPNPSFGTFPDSPATNTSSSAPGAYFDTTQTGEETPHLPISVRRRSRAPMSGYFARAHVRLQATADRKAFAEMHQQIAHAQQQLQQQSAAQQLHQATSGASSSHSSSSSATTSSSSASSTSSSTSSASAASSAMAITQESRYSSTYQQNHRSHQHQHASSESGNHNNGSSSASSTASSTASSAYGGGGATSTTEYISPSHLSHRGSHSLSSNAHSPEASPRRSITPEDLIQDPFYLDTALSNSATAHLNVEPMDHMMSSHSSAYASYSSTPTSTNNGHAHSSGITTVAGPSMTYNPNTAAHPSPTSTSHPSNSSYSHSTNGLVYPSPTHAAGMYAGGGFGASSSSPSLAHLSSGASPANSSSGANPGPHTHNGLNPAYAAAMPPISLPTRQAKINAANNLMVATAGLNSNSQSVSIMLKSNVPHRGRTAGDKGFPPGMAGMHSPYPYGTDMYGQSLSSSYGGHYSRASPHPQVVDPIIIPLPLGWFERALKNPSLRKRSTTQEIELPVWKEIDEEEDREFWETVPFDGSDEDENDELKYILNHREYEKEEKKLKKLCL